MLYKPVLVNNSAPLVIGCPYCAGGSCFVLQVPLPSDGLPGGLSRSEQLDLTFPVSDQFMTTPQTAGPAAEGHMFTNLRRICRTACTLSFPDHHGWLSDWLGIAR